MRRDGTYSSRVSASLSSCFMELSKDSAAERQQLLLSREKRRAILQPRMYLAHGAGLVEARVPVMGTRTIQAAQATGHPRPEDALASAAWKLRRRGCGTSQERVTTMTKSSGLGASTDIIKSMMLCRICSAGTRHDQRDCAVAAKVSRQKNAFRPFRAGKVGS